jgi:hypothetical protein
MRKITISGCLFEVTEKNTFIKNIGAIGLIDVFIHAFSLRFNRSIQFINVLQDE